jgi:rsbT co-antagonist protein RsbR
MSITLEEWERRKRFVGFGAADEQVLSELHLVAKTYADQVMDELYSRWLQFDELRAFFENPETLAHVKRHQRQYFIRLTSGNYGAEYLEDRLRIGHVHRRVGLSPRWYMGAYSIYMQTVFPRVLAAFEYDRRKRELAISALLKLISLDQEIALLVYFAELGADEPEAPRVTDSRKP